MYIFLGYSKPILILFKKVEYNLFINFEQMHNGNLVFHTKYGKFVYMFYVQKHFIHTTYKNVHILYG